MMIAGYFSTSSLSLSSVQLIKKKSVQLLLPFVVWSLIIFTGVNISASLSSILILNFWFLKTMFVCYLLMYFGISILGRYIHEAAAILISLTLSQLVTSHQIPEMFPAFCAGYVIKRYNRYFVSSAVRISIIVGLLWSSLLFLIEFCIINDPILSRLTKVVIGLCGALFFFELFIALFNSPSNSKLSAKLGEWGGMTMGIYILQAILLEKVLANIINFDSSSPIVFHVVIAPIISFVILVISVLIINTIRKNEYSAFLLLGEHKIKK